MKQDKLISMVDFVKELDNEVIGVSTSASAYSKCFNYANFLSQPLTLGMFVPCLDGVVLDAITYKEWLKLDKYPLHFVDFFDYEMEYDKAKERVLFGGNSKEVIEFMTSIINNNNDLTIEDLRIYENTFNLGLTLTETALKQIGLNN